MLEAALVVLPVPPFAADPLAGVAVAAADDTAAGATNGVALGDCLTADVAAEAGATVEGFGAAAAVAAEAEAAVEVLGAAAAEVGATVALFGGNDT